jgi:hypothetical protein
MSYMLVTDGPATFASLVFIPCGFGNSKQIFPVCFNPLLNFKSVLNLLCHYL